MWRLICKHELKIKQRYKAKDKSDQLKTPYTRWIMMSLKGDGAYNLSDYSFTRSFQDPYERKTAINAEIVKRINEYGIDGLLVLFQRKCVVFLGDATLAQSDFLDDNPSNDSALHKLVLYNGEYHQIYRHVCSGVLFGMLLLSLAFGFQNLFSKKRRTEFYAPAIALLGTLLFFMIWEASGRYFTNYIPIILICSAPVFRTLPKHIRLHKSKKKCAALRT